MCNKELIGIHDHGVKVVPSPKGPRPNAFLPGGMAHRGNLTEGEIVAAFKSGYLVPRPPAEQAAEIATLRAVLDGLVEAAGAVLASNALDPDEFLALDRGILAALAAARPDPRGRGHDHSAAQRNRVPHEDEAVSVSESRP